MQGNVCPTQRFCYMLVEVHIGAAAEWLLSHVIPRRSSSVRDLYLAAPTYIVRKFDPSGLLGLLPTPH